MSNDNLEILYRRKYLKNNQNIIIDPDFDWEFYVNKYEDLRNAGINTKEKAWKHWNDHGSNEGRICIGIIDDFDFKYYYKFNNESIKHFINIGMVANNKYLNNIIDYYFHHDSVEGNKIRGLYTYDDCLIDYKKNRLPYYIYSYESFFTIYNDFDIKFYKNKYNLYGSDTDIMYHYHTIGKYNRLLYNDMIKIVIFTPKLYMNCGGHVILHYIAKMINDLKYKNIYAKLYCYDGSKYNNIFCNDFADINEINDNTVVIYPEIIKNNPLNAKNVIRWILLDLGIEMPTNHYINWSKNDIVYHWEPSKLKNTKQLSIPYLDSKIKNCNNNNRAKTCYLIKKASLIHKNINYMHPNDSISLDNKNIDEIIDIFNNCKYFYCYDPNTFYMIIAPICGCITILYPLEEYTRLEYFKNRMTYKNGYIYDSGIAYGNIDSEIVYALNTLNESLNNFNKLLDIYINELILFLDDIYMYIKENKKIQTINDVYY